jgi:hypothetical protein
VLRRGALRRYPGAPVRALSGRARLAPSASLSVTRHVLITYGFIPDTHGKYPDHHPC